MASTGAHLDSNSLWLALANTMEKKSQAEGMTAMPVKVIFSAIVLGMKGKKVKVLPASIIARLAIPIAKPILEVCLGLRKRVKTPMPLVKIRLNAGMIAKRLNTDAPALSVKNHVFNYKEVSKKGQYQE